MKNTEKFRGMGGVYARYRPSYPNEFVDYAVAFAGLGEGCAVADVGSGTGKLTRLLLERGLTVYAVEPNADMRAEAEKNLHAYERFISVSGAAENTTLENESIDCVTAAQAFHWFDGKLFKAECKRILKPSGKVVLVWNRRDDASALVSENDALNAKHCPNFKGFAGGMRGPEKDGEFDGFFEGKYEAKIFRYDIDFDEEGFVGRNLSSSYAPKESDAGYAAYVSEMKSLFAKYENDGRVTMSNEVCAFAGKV